ncbi:MAG: hypothetical protein AAB400_01205 [Patescibacteria group bacterium]
MEQAFELTFDPGKRAEKRVFAHVVETPEFVRSQENIQATERSERTDKIEQARESLRSRSAEAVEQASETGVASEAATITDRIKELKVSLGGPVSYAYLASARAGFLALLPWTKTHAHTKLYVAEHLISEGDLSQAEQLLTNLEQSR